MYFGIYGYNRFLYCVWTSSRAFYIHLFKNKRAANDYRLEDKLFSSQKAAITFKTEKLIDHVGSGPKKSEISCNVNQYKYLLIIN